MTLVNENLVLARISVPMKEVTIHPSMKEDQEIKFRVVNPTEHTVCFKVRSTRMDQLYMKPSFGLIQSNRAIYMRIKLRKLSTPEWDFQQDHLSIHFAVVPLGMVVGKPSDFWKQPEPSRKVLVHTINVNYGKPIEMLKGKKPCEMIGTSKDQPEMEEGNPAVDATAVLEKMDMSKQIETTALMDASKFLKLAEATALLKASKISKLAEATALPENMDTAKKAVTTALMEASKMLKLQEATALMDASNISKLAEATAVLEASKMSRLAEATAMPGNMDETKKAETTAILEASNILKLHEATALMDASKISKLAEATALLKASKISKLAEITAMSANMDETKNVETTALLEASKMFKLKEATALIDASRISKLSEATALSTNMDVSKQYEATALMGAPRTSKLMEATALSTNLDAAERSKTKTPDKDSKTKVTKQSPAAVSSMNASMSGTDMSRVSRTSNENSQDFTFNPSMAIMENLPEEAKKTEKKDPTDRNKK
ncbi:hypothetical protein T4E_8319 [Trichinella pseudospiralis]|uniref:Major sperm protein n=1 Tax=Trichinella pseudospiralis TaxID=6337 RepID=A0A0V0XWZ3_TRIPS|nr:hypothetical protein T4E_8319 [Trichinella pseudospiralis]